MSENAVFISIFAHDTMTNRGDKMAARFYVSGSMNRGWLSDIGKSKYVTDRVRAVATDARIIAQAHASSRGSWLPSDYSEVRAVGPGIWNTTFIIRPTSPTAMAHPEDLDAAATKAGSRKKGM
jgi:hypothetical protein